MLEKMIFVKKQMDVFGSDENNKVYTEQINTFITSVYGYIEKNCLTITQSWAGSLLVEAQVKYLN
jgi:hypothetical protein